jgi:REP element-mobilizing transposase RayT
MANKREILVPDGFFHVYNRANADDKLFTCQNEYELFIKKYFVFSNLIFSTYGYCLLSNHFHFLIKIHSEDELNRNIGKFKDDKSRSNFIAQHFGNFFNWYATYFNRKHNRKGSLFMHTFHRKQIKDQVYLNLIVCYIHANPIKAGLCKNFEEWDYSSYNEFFQKPIFISGANRKELLQWFDGIDNFKDSHMLYLHNEL